MGSFVGGGSPGGEGLSYAHIVTQGAAALAVGDDAGAPEAWQVPAAVVRVQGGLLEVERVPQEQAGAHTGRRRRRLRALGNEEQLGGGRRGKVATFSRASRRRMLKMLARLRVDALPAFVTLTLPDGVPCDGAAVKLYLRRFRERCRRAYPHVAFVWRLEGVDRKSGSQLGEVVPHLHCLVYGVVAMKQFRAWLSRAWYESVGSGDEKHLRAGTQCKAAANGRQVRAYVSKLYAAKGSPADERIENAGRFWGVHNDGALPWAEGYIRALTFTEAVRVLRVLRGYARASLRRRGKHRRIRGWTFTFVDNAERWAGLLESGALLGPACGCVRE